MDSNEDIKHLRKVAVDAAMVAGHLSFKLAMSRKKVEIFQRYMSKEDIKKATDDYEFYKIDSQKNIKR